MAGPIERAGFIEAPLIGPPTRAPRATVPPMASAAACPTARISVATAVITTIRKNVSTTSQAKDWMSEPAGCVTPRSASGPSVARRAIAAMVAPRIWADAYAATFDQGRCRPMPKAIETAGLKCAPEM